MPRGARFAIGLVVVLGLSLVPAAQAVARDPLQPSVDATWPTPLTWGDDWTMTVTVTAEGAVPTGEVRASWDGPDGGAGEPVLLATGSLSDGGAELTIDGQALPTGGRGVTVTYEGDGVVAPGTSVGLTPFVEHASSRRPALTVSRAPAPHHKGAARVRVLAKRAGMPAPTGKVIVRMQGGHAVKRVLRTLDDGVTVLPLPRLHRGPWVLRARYLGDEHYRLRISDDLVISVD